MSSSPSVFIVGAGAVGCGLALAIRERGGNVVGIWNRGEERAAVAEELLGLTVRRGALRAVGHVMNDADLVLVAVTDSAVAEAGEALAKRGMRAGTTVAHVSGSLPASALGDLNPAVVGSIHPLVACPEPTRTAEAVMGAMFALEGEKPALERLQQIVELLGGRSEVIRPENKPRYHAAAVLASNLVVSLVDMAVEQGMVAGLTDGRAAFVELARGALQQLTALPASSALTGPVARGDSETVRKHLETLAPSQTAEVYRILSRRAMELARAKGLSEDLIDELYDSLEK